MDITFEGAVKASNDLIRLIKIVNGNFVTQEICGDLKDERAVEKRLNILRARVDALIKNGQENTVQVFVQKCMDRTVRHFAIDRLVAHKKTISLEEVSIFVDVLLKDEHPESEKTKQLLQRVLAAADVAVDLSLFAAADHMQQEEVDMLH